MKTFRKQILAAALTAAMCLGAFAGCSGTQTQSGTVTVGITQEPGTFDPHAVVAAGDQEIIFNIYEGLYKFDSTGTLQPALATDCQISDDATEYKFTIRQGVKFHNGQEMTTDDVVYSLKRAAGMLGSQNGTPYVASFGDFKSVDADSDTVTVTLNTPNSELLSYFTTGIIPANYEDCAAAPIGTGPFVFESYSVNQNVTLKANEDYWGDGPYIDSVVFKICADLDAGLLELQNGSIDIFPHMTKDRSDQLSSDAFEIKTNASNMVQVFALNNEVVPEEVREAINYAINRQDVISMSMDGAGVELTTAMSPAMGKYYDTSLDGTYTQDIEKAKDLLSQAGFADGYDLTVTVPSSYLVHVNTAIELSAELKEVGINLTIEQVDWATWLSNVYTDRNYESTVICITSDFAPYDVLERYTTDASGNFINYSNSKVDELMAQIPLTTDEDAKVELYHEVLALITEDNASCYIQDPTEITAVSTRLEGFEVYPMYVQDLSTVKIK